MVVNNKEDRDATYFSYYSQLGHQQNMLIDQVRTSTYYNAIHNSIASFHNKTIMDVGAGNGILSFFAAQVGASKVILFKNRVNKCRYGPWRLVKWPIN